MADFSQIQADVANLTTVVDSAVAAFNGVADQIDAAIAANDAGDNSQLATLSSDVRAQASRLAGAIVTGTPAEETETIPPTEGGGEPA